MGWKTYFMISLSLMIFLISAIKMELTHTIIDISLSCRVRRHCH
jgi:hypothetical protein